MVIFGEELQCQTKLIRKKYNKKITHCHHTTLNILQTIPFSLLLKQTQAPDPKQKNRHGNKSSILSLT